MRWRKTLLSLHRDIGYFSVGLIVLYAVSGIAVNHRQHWDPNFSTRQETTTIGTPETLLGDKAKTFDPQTRADPSKLARAAQEELVKAISAKVTEGEVPRKAFWRGGDRLSLFFGEGNKRVVDYRPTLGTTEETVTRPRHLLRLFNRLHLNERHGAWTWLADGFALALIFLGGSGALILRGKKGLAGRGGMFLIAGLVIPLLGILWLG